MKRFLGKNLLKGLKRKVTRSPAPCTAPMSAWSDRVSGVVRRRSMHFLGRCAKASVRNEIFDVHLKHWRP